MGGAVKSHVACRQVCSLHKRSMVVSGIHGAGRERDFRAPRRQTVMDTARLNCITFLYAP